MEVFDIETEDWSLIQTYGNSPSIRNNHASCVYSDNIYIHGGHDGEKWLDDFFIYESKTNTWKEIIINSYKPKARACHSISIIGRKIFLYGGFDGKESFGDVEVFDIETHIWSVLEINFAYNLNEKEEVINEEAYNNIKPKNNFENSNLNPKNKNYNKNFSNSINNKDLSLNTLKAFDKQNNKIVNWENKNILIENNNQFHNKSFRNLNKSPNNNNSQIKLEFNLNNQKNDLKQNTKNFIDIESPITNKSRSIERNNKIENSEKDIIFYINQKEDISESKNNSMIKYDGNKNIKLNNNYEFYDKSIFNLNAIHNNSYQINALNIPKYNSNNLSKLDSNQNSNKKINKLFHMNANNNENKNIYNSPVNLNEKFINYKNNAFFAKNNFNNLSSPIKITDNGNINNFFDNKSNENNINKGILLKESKNTNKNLISNNHCCSNKNNFKKNSFLEINYSLKMSRRESEENSIDYIINDASSHLIENSNSKKFFLSKKTQNEEKNKSLNELFLKEIKDNQVGSDNFSKSDKKLINSNYKCNKIISKNILNSNDEIDLENNKSRIYRDIEIIESDHNLEKNDRSHMHGNFHDNTLCGLKSQYRGGIIHTSCSFYDSNHGFKQENHEENKNRIEPNENVIICEDSNAIKKNKQKIDYSKSINFLVNYTACSNINRKEKIEKEELTSCLIKNRSNLEKDNFNLYSSSNEILLSGIDYKLKEKQFNSPSDGFYKNHEILNLKLNNYKIFTFLNWKKIKADKMPSARNAHSATVINKYLFIFGGHCKNIHLNDLIILDTINNCWLIPNLFGVVPRGLRGHSSSAIFNKFYIFGGYDGKNRVNDLYRFSLEDFKFIKIPNNRQLIFPRQRHTANVYNYKIYFFGGFEGNKWMNNLDILNINHLENNLLLEDFKQIIKSDFVYILNNKEYSDITFTFQSKQIYAHKALLCMRVEYFKNMFSEHMLEKDFELIEINEYSFEIFFEFLTYVYTAEINKKDYIVLIELFRLSDNYSYDPLKKYTEVELSLKLNLQNVIEVLIIGYKCNSNLLEKTSIDFIFENRKDSFLLKEIQNLIEYPNLMAKILKSLADI